MCFTQLLTFASVIVLGFSLYPAAASSIPADCFEYDVGYPGGEFAKINNIKTPEECLQLCMEDERCKVFTLDTYQRCRLKTENFRSRGNFKGRISGQRKNCVSSEEKERSILMVVDGHYRPGQVELVDLSNPSFVPPIGCQPVAAVPEQLFTPGSGVVEGRPTLCGYTKAKGHSVCYVYFSTNNTWELAADMPSIKTPFHSLSSVVQKDADGAEFLWVTGGRTNMGHEAGFTAAFYGRNWTTEETQKMPDNMNQQCVARINDTHVFVGGGDTTFRNETLQIFLYDTEHETMEMLPDLPSSVKLPTCVHQEGRILVMGGLGSLLVQILDLDQRTWSMGQPLDKLLYANCVMPTPEGTLLIGGQKSRGVAYNTITRYIPDQEPASEELITLSGALAEGTSSCGVFLLSEDELPCN